MNLRITQAGPLTMQRITALLDQIYGTTLSISHRQQLLKAINDAREGIEHLRKPHWDQQDVVLISYADQFYEQGVPTLRTFDRFRQQHLQDSFTLLHLLPFYPWSADDGFSVIDYHQVNPPYGGWAEIAELHRHTRLMFDFVCNHMSAHSGWFKHYLAQDAGWDDFFISMPPNADLSAVIRPRTSPLLTKFTLQSGETRLLWTTFSSDQVDLNFASGAVLLKMVGVLLDYLQKGADYVRLDAVGYMWKTPGTTCIHLEKTHLLVKLFRAIADEVAPGTVIVTETNVPHQDNIRYFGNGADEAQMVYQFTLPPLVLHAIHTGSSTVLGQWAATLTPGSSPTTFFNFLASHDGIGLNPLRGILPEEEIASLVRDLAAEGALVSWKNNPDGSTSPYEVNVTWMDALNQQADDDDRRLRRFMLSHALLLAFPGVPAIYIQSLLGSRNDREGVTAAGYARAINRQKYQIDEIEQELADAGSLRHQTFHALRALIQTRMRQPAFHPDSPLQVLASDERLLALRRGGAGSAERLLCVFNLSAETVSYALAEDRYWLDVAGGNRVDGSELLVLAPWKYYWLKA